VQKSIINREVGKDSKLFEGAAVNQLTHSAGVSIEHDGLRHIYASGKTATFDQSDDPADWDTIVGPGDIFEQTRQVCRNIQTTVEAAGATLNDIVRVRVYVTQPMAPADFHKIHEARAEFFESAHYPASTLIVVHALARADALIEIDADAVIPVTPAGVSS
jgi:enamine deaminase RidA (YjgF/YER057c/UK114 family)